MSGWFPSVPWANTVCICYNCPYAAIDDSDGYESDTPALQLMTTEAEIHDNFDTTRLNEETDYLNL